MMRVALTLCAVVLLAACGEKPQTGAGVKSDTPVFQGVQNSFVAPGWKPGDKTSWEQGLKARLQNSQNEYPKMKTSKE
jgi:major membrane immunogen (membrane-anchored lipoprotein)